MKLFVSTLAQEQQEIKTLILWKYFLEVSDFLYKIFVSLKIFLFFSTEKLFDLILFIILGSTKKLSKNFSLGKAVSKILNSRTD